MQLGRATVRGVSDLLAAARSAAACKRTRAVARIGGAAIGTDGPVAAGWDDFQNCGTLTSTLRPRLPQVVHPGRESRARSGACSAYESDSAGLLAERHETVDRQAPSRPHGLTVAAGVVPGFMPKAQLRADGRRRLDGLRRGALEIGDLRVGGGRSGTARARASARRLGSAGAGCPTRVGSVGGVRGRGRRGVPSRGVRSIRLSRRVRRLRT